MMTIEPGDIRDLLYPSEWVFRCLIAAFLVQIASTIIHHPDPLLHVGFYGLAVGACASAVWQGVVFVKYRHKIMD
jgi:hypothetical protein